MKFNFTDEQKNVVGQLLANLIIKFQPSRHERRYWTKLASKFRPGATYIDLKPMQQSKLLVLLGQSMQAVDTVVEKNQPQGFLEKAKAAILPNENEAKLIKMREVFDSVTRKLSHVHNTNPL